MATFRSRSDEILEPGWHDLGMESLDPVVIRAVGISSPHGVTMTFPAPNLEEVRRWVLKWGASAQVTRPRELVETLKKVASDLSRLYRE